jgi:hypothetical protein
MIALLQSRAEGLWSRQHVRPNVRYKLERAGIIDALGSENIVDSLEAAIVRANASLGGLPQRT